VGSLPLVEFPPVIGTRVLFDDPRMVLKRDSDYRAAVKVTRRTYPTARVEALGRVVPAVKIVLDFEIATLHLPTRRQSDLLIRESRWFSPEGGRVRSEVTTLQREEGAFTAKIKTIVANSMTGTFFAAPVPPFAGVIDVTSLALRHRHAVYAPARARIYAATDTSGGQLLELDAATLATTRTVSLVAVPGRLAVAADGTRLYAGLDGGRVVELETAGLSVVRQFTVPADPHGRPYDRIYDLAVDPFDAERVLVLAGSKDIFGRSGAVLVYRNGTLMLRDAPRSGAYDYGWGYYGLNTIAWSSVRDEFIGAFLGSPDWLYRFHAGTTAITDVSSLEWGATTPIRDVGGVIVTTQGAILDAASFATVRTLDLVPFALQGCQRLTTESDLCGIDGGYAWSPPYFVHLDHATGAFLGTYRPRIAEVANACPKLSVREGSLGLDGAVVVAMGDGRSLVSTLNDGEAQCGLQVWTLHGAAP
jgi:hypothetical protein